MQKSYSINANVWLFSKGAGWHFVTLPIEIAEEINYFFAQSKKGWGSLPVNVRIGQTSWTTSIFPDKKSGSYFLPLKAAVRKKEEIKEGDVISLSLEIKG